MFFSENPAQSFFVGIVTSQVWETESRFNKERRKQRGVVTKSASRGQHVGFVVMSADTFGNFWQKQSRDGDRQCGKTNASKDGAALLGQHGQAEAHGGGCSQLKDPLIQPMEAALNQTTFLTQAHALLGNTISEHTTQRNAEVKSIINKDRQVVPKRMPLSARLAVNTHNVGGRFVE